MAFTDIAARSIGPVVCLLSLMVNLYLFRTLNSGMEGMAQATADLTLLVQDLKEQQQQTQMITAAKSIEDDTTQPQLELTSSPPLYYGSGGEVNLTKLFHSFLTKDFALYVVVYYAYYIGLIGIVTSLAVFVFKVDYTKTIDSNQLKREVLLTLESYTTNAIMYWITLQLVPSWDTSTDLFKVGISFLVNLNVFNLWFYFSHKLWHTNRTLYKWIHEHHHQSTIVCPLTALSNAWPESVWTSFGFAIGPLFLSTNNVWAYYMTTFVVVWVAVLGHSRLPYTLEHATHHALVSKNFGFFSSRAGFLYWDRIFGTWAYAGEVAKVRRVYAKEVKSYTWNGDGHKIHWDNIDELDGSSSSSSSSSSSDICSDDEAETDATVNETSVSSSVDDTSSDLGNSVSEKKKKRDEKAAMFLEQMKTFVSL